MAPENNNWLSFSLSSMDQMLNSHNKIAETFHDSSSAAANDDDSHHYYSFADNFYANNGWTNNQKPQEMYNPEPENSPFAATYMHAPPPKLEDFFAGGGDSTETQDSSLTHIYDNHHHHQHCGATTGTTTTTAIYYEQQDLKTITGFQALSANSGSEVDDSAFAGRNQSPVESPAEMVAYSQCPFTNATTANALSLGVSVNESGNSNNSKAIVVVADNNQPGNTCKKISDTFGQRTSIYRGVTRHRWTGRYEAHLWDNSCRREGQARKGRQVYLGGYDKEDKAARAYDLAALKYWGPTATTNFPMANYAKEVEEMKNATKQEFIASLRRKSSGFSRGASIYRGVTRHHQQGRWQARIGRVAGNKDLYLGTFATEEEAAEAYDIAAIKFRGINAVTNFEMNRYDVEAIANSPLPVGGTAKRLKLSLEAEDHKLNPTMALQQVHHHNHPCISNISFATSSSIPPHTPTIPYGVPYDAATSAPPFYHHNLFHHYQPAGPTTTTNSDTSSSVSSMVTPMSEFFIWPHHQSY